MEIDATSLRELKKSESDVFASVNALGEVLEEYDIELGTYDKRFKRSDEYNEALDELRRYTT